MKNDYIYLSVTISKTDKVYKLKKKPQKMKIITFFSVIFIFLSIKLFQ
jgi:hypothetical protein